MNDEELRLLKLIEKVYVPSVISCDYNNGYNKKLKSYHKKKSNRPVDRYITHDSYEIYRKEKLPPNEIHLNFVSFLKISFFIFQEILRNIIFNGLSWKIYGIAVIECSSNIRTLNGEKTNVISTLTNYFHNTHSYIKRFSFKMKNTVRNIYINDYQKYQEKFVHKQVKKIKTI